MVKGGEPEVKERVSLFVAVEQVCFFHDMGHEIMSACGCASLDASAKIDTNEYIFFRNHCL